MESTNIVVFFQFSVVNGALSKSAYNHLLRHNKIEKNPKFWYLQQFWMTIFNKPCRIFTAPGQIYSILCLDLLCCRFVHFLLWVKEGERGKLATCVRAVDNTKKSCPETCKWKKGICRGHSLFSPEAVIYLGQSPTLNHCVCFYGLGGFACAPQPLRAVRGAAGFSPNLGIVKPQFPRTWGAPGILSRAALGRCIQMRCGMCACFSFLLSWVCCGNSNRFAATENHFRINSWRVCELAINWPQKYHFLLLV